MSASWALGRGSSCKTGFPRGDGHGAGLQVVPCIPASLNSLSRPSGSQVLQAGYLLLWRLILIWSHLPEPLAVCLFIYVIPPEDGLLHSLICLGLVRGESRLGLLRLPGEVWDKLVRSALPVDLIGSHYPFKCGEV